MGIAPVGLRRAGKVEHGTVETGGVAAPRIDDQHFGSCLAVAVDEADELLRVVTLIEQVAADDQVEAPQLRVFASPAAAAAGNRRQLVQRGIAGQEFAGQRVVVAGRDVRALPLQHLAGPPQAAAQFEDAQPAGRIAAHAARKHFAGWPQLAEQRPGRVGDARPFGGAVAVGELLVVAQRAEVIILGPDTECGILDAVAWHGRLGLLNGRVTEMDRSARGNRRAPAEDHRGALHSRHAMPIRQR